MYFSNKNNPLFIIWTPYNLTTNILHIFTQNKTPNKLLNQEQMLGFLVSLSK